MSEMFDDFRQAGRNIKMSVDEQLEALEAIVSANHQHQEAEKILTAERDALLQENENLIYDSTLYDNTKAELVDKVKDRDQLREDYQYLTDCHSILQGAYATDSKTIKGLRFHLTTAREAMQNAIGAIFFSEAKNFLYEALTKLDADSTTNNSTNNEQDKATSVAKKHTRYHNGEWINDEVDR